MLSPSLRQGHGLRQRPPQMVGDDQSSITNPRDFASPVDGILMTLRGAIGPSR
jgi:hypothetical protein